MSSSIYADPDVGKIVKYSKIVRKDRGDRLEKVENIYESTDAFPDDEVDASGRDGGVCTQNHLPAVQRNPFRAATLCLALLCFLLLLGIVFLSYFYFTLVWKNNQLIKDAELKDAELKDAELQIAELIKHAKLRDAKLKDAELKANRECNTDDNESSGNVPQDL